MAEEALELPATRIVDQSVLCSLEAVYRVFNLF